ncbi:MAG: molybdopterin-dependent oxidoreductase [Rhodanobacteraceae bacterium]
MSILSRLVIAMLLCGAIAVASPQHALADGAAVANTGTQLDVGGEVATPLHLSAVDLARLPHVQVHAKLHDVEADWDGVPLVELLRAAGAPLGDKLRGPNLALYVRIVAADKYVAVYSLAELDSGIGGAQVILADRRDGKPLDAEEGPLRIIAPGDKRPARSVRQVRSIDVLRAPSS